MQTKQYILGGGISGLIWGFYNKDFFIISPEIGGQLSSSFQLGPRFLIADEFSKKLLIDLNLKLEKEIIKVGYFKNNKFCIKDDDFKKEYYKKSRGMKYCIDKTAMNAGKEKFESFKVNFLELIDALKKQVMQNIITNKVARINQRYRYIYMKGTGTSFPYKKIISTIPLDKFIDCLSHPKKNCELKSKDATYVLLKKTFFDTKDFDFIYVLGKKFHRITKTQKGLVIDWLGEHHVEECKEEFKEYYIDSFVLKDAQIISKKCFPKMQETIFSGRYGAWDRTYKINKVIKEATEYAKKNKI